MSLCKLRSLALPSDTVHVWQIALMADSDRQADLLACLSAEEQARMKRFIRPQDQVRFGLCRATLRYLLSRYSQTAPAAVAFQYGPHGKPYLASGEPAQTLQFNLSHSDSWALVAVGHQPLGVDLEVVRPLNYLSGLIQSCLTATEQESLAGLSPQEASRQFFRYWTCKEAYLKAIGKGLQVSMKSITLDWRQATPYAGADSTWMVPLEGAWHILAWEAGMNQLAALALPAWAEAACPSVLWRSIQPGDLV